MKISTRTRYGLRAIAEIAEHEAGRPIRLKTIAERQDISVKYLEQLMTMLRSAGFVRSIRGSKGGYVLARLPSQIKLSELFRALEGSVTTTECVEDSDYCERSADCAARLVWMRVEEAIEAVLDSITLEDMLAETKKTARMDYQI